MGKNYRHLDSEARLKIHQLLLQSFGIQEIVEQLGYHRATLFEQQEGKNGIKQDFK